MRPSAHRLPALGLAVLGMALSGCASAIPADSRAPRSQPAYIKSVAPGVTVTPLLSVGDAVPRTGRSGLYRFVGIPDGLGAYDNGNGTLSLLVNHELDDGEVSKPTDEAVMSGALISHFVLDRQRGTVLSGDLAFTSVSVEASEDTVTGRLSGLCSGFLAGPDEGFDRLIYLTGEESEGKQTFNGRGGSGVAVLDGRAHLLPRMGLSPKENLVVLPHTGARTVIFVLEDRGGDWGAHLYLYVGTKEPGAPHPLIRNGLTNGNLYVFISDSPQHRGEATFHKADGVLSGHWVRLDGADRMTDTELHRSSRKAGGFRFVRIEDGASDRNRPGAFYFATTGEKPANRRGRLYRLTMNPDDPLGSTTKLRVLLEGDAGDPILSPDNLDISRDGLLMIQEDVTGGFRGGLPDGRDGSIWLYRISDGRLARVAEIDQRAVPEPLRRITGYWETSGALDVAPLLGPGRWLVDVQAHSINSRAASKLAGLDDDAQVFEGGQLLLLTIDPEQVFAGPNPSSPSAITAR